MTSPRKLCSKMFALAFAFVVVCPLQAQFNPLDPLNLTSVFGGPTVDQNGIRFQQPHLDQIPQFLQALPVNVAQSFLNPLGSALAISIRQARQNARNAGCGPAPPRVVSQLSPFMPPSVFNGVCWAVLRPGFGIDTLVIQDGGMNAVTLDDTIVFSDQQSALDPVLWAHELIHVGQYRRLSVEGFANIYSYDFKRLEGEAYAFQDFVAARINLYPGGDGWRSSYYNPSDNWQLSTGLNGTRWSQRAQAALDPRACINVQGASDAAGNSIQVFNNCPISVVAATFRWDQLPPVRCNSNCEVPPGTGMAFSVPPGVVHADVNIVW
jgi:hypothetical protein